MCKLQVGIIPTDTYPALVCDINAPTSSLETLYAAKDMSPRKPLSILCRGFQDVTTYTLGFPAPSTAGQEDFFRLARRILPGPVGQDRIFSLPHIQLVLYFGFSCHGLA